MSGPPAERFEVGLTCPADVGFINECKGNRFDRVDLDLPITNAIPTTGFHTGPLP